MSLIRSHLTIQMADESFDIAQLGADSEGDFYYHFSYPKNFKNKAWNLSKRTMGYRPDHISWHRDGTIHIRSKQRKERILLGSAGESFLASPPDIITPLLIDSIYWTPHGWELPFSKSKIYNGWSFSQITNFSVLLFLIHKSRSPAACLNRNNLNVFWKPYTQILRFEAFQNWNIIALLSDHVFPLETILLESNNFNNNQPKQISYGRSFAPIDLHIHFNRLVNPVAQQFLLEHRL